MSRRVTLSGTQLDADEIAEHYSIVEAAIHLYFTDVNPDFGTKYAFYTRDEVIAERNQTLAETGAASAMTLLASIEAAFRVDYLVRCTERHRDELTRAFRTLYSNKGARVSLVDDLLEVWQEQRRGTRKLVNDVRRAFGYRNWLAHGRYWQPKLGRVYDFMSVYILAQEVEQMLSSDE